MNRMTAFVNEQVETQEDWQAKVSRLEQCVCNLMMKNQTLRTALQAERARAQGSNYSYDVFADSSIA